MYNYLHVYSTYTITYTYTRTDTYTHTNTYTYTNTYTNTYTCTNTYTYIKHSCGKSPFLMGKSTINGHDFPTPMDEQNVPRSTAVPDTSQILC